MCLLLLLLLLLLVLLLLLPLQAHHLLNNGALVNQADGRGWTPLHRAAHLAHLEGYMEIYEYLLVCWVWPPLGDSLFSA
jgi:hypothetical protein